MLNMLTPLPQGAYPDGVTGDERALVTRLLRKVAGAGLRVGSLPVIHLYVALKSKRLALLTGPAHTGKIALIESFGQALTGGARLQCQMLVGHAWWAGKSGDVALCTEAQARLNAGKILALIEEASLPENAHRVYLACLSRISPAEVVGLMQEIALQLQSGSMLSLHGLPLKRPVPFPPNLRLIATMDTERLDWADAQLLSQAALVEWLARPALPGDLVPPAPCLADGQRLFLQACVQDVPAARAKLRRVLGAWPAAFAPLARIATVLRGAGVNPAAVIGDVLVFLANAWTTTGQGLFDPAPVRNLALAADLALAQALHPLRDLPPVLRQQVREVLHDQQCVLAAAAIERLG